MNYWFIYREDNGEICGAPYKGGATEWNNIPNGCKVIGFLENNITDEVKKAFENPKKYKVINNKLVINEDYVEIKILQVPSDSDRLTALESAISTLMGV